MLNSNHAAKKTGDNNNISWPVTWKRLHGEQGEEVREGNNNTHKQGHLLNILVTATVLRPVLNPPPHSYTLRITLMPNSQFTLIPKSHTVQCPTAQFTASPSARSYGLSMARRLDAELGMPHKIMMSQVGAVWHMA